MSNAVVGVTPKGDKAAMILLADGPPAWCPEYEDAKKLVIGQPIPSEWTQKQGDFGPQAFPPRAKKDKAFSVAFRNTAEGQAYEQERMDRRTALMQAVNACMLPDGMSEHVFTVADNYYTWLRQTVGGTTSSSPGASGQPARDAGPPAQSAVVNEPGTENPGIGKAAADKGTGGGSGEAPAPGSHTHEGSPLKMDGTELPSGKLRCITCGIVSKSKGVW